jgi:ribosomal protein S18 acetylase RimI-like enzyme
MTLVFGIGGLSVKELCRFFANCDNQFSPLLSSRVRLVKYSEKLVLNSIIIHAKENNKIIGLIAFYANESSLDYAYISLICVLKGYEGKGIGKRLIDECILHINKKGFKSIKLEVNNDNQNAISFYTKIGFHIKKQNQQSYIMLKPIY